MSLVSSGIAQFKNELAGIETNESKIREFAFVVGGVLVGLGVFAFYRGHDGQSGLFVGAGALLAALGIIHPKVLHPLHRLWMGLAVVLSVVVGNTLLTLFYFLVVTPLGLLRRFFRGASIHKEESYWLPVSSLKKETLERPF
jgi:hypothetical protein